MNAPPKNLLFHDAKTQISAKAAAFAAQPKQLFIDNAFRDAIDGGVFASEDPATGIKICDFAAATAADVNAAVHSSHDAFENGWRDATPAARAALMLKLADLLTEHVEELAELESLDNG
ncbi:MAG TPA: aldehyde dehydrogenase family protein, partial [Sphingobium sp.]|uniref:aldehyde dehydrogenase family protein n=1 Tax=Sphingobium sp. TaxID=1912891 RepID=UPI002ED5DF98